MKENKFRFLKGGAVAALVGLTAITPVFAGDTPGHPTEGGGATNTTGTQDAIVSYSGSSSYSVVIPETITIGSSKTATYSVNVTGDLASGDTVTITPASSFTMSATGKTDVTATVEQTTTSWTLSTLGTAATGTIDASGLTAGEWTGTLTFTINYTAASAGSGSDLGGQGSTTTPQ